MKKIIGNLTYGLIIALAIVCMGVFAAACKDDKKNVGTDFTVCVVYPDGKAVDGTKDGSGNYGNYKIDVQFCEVDASNNELHCELPIYLSADGKATASSLPALEAGHKWHIKLNNLPAAYSYDDAYMAEPSTITITLKNI